MSLEIAEPPHAFAGFPRVSGDEPASPVSSKASAMFSPRERG